MPLGQLGDVRRHIPAGQDLWSAVWIKSATAVGVGSPQRWHHGRVSTEDRPPVGEDQEPHETIVRGADYWIEHLDDLRVALADRADDTVDPPGRAVRPKAPAIAIRSASFWIDEPAALREALVAAVFEHAMRVPVPDQVEEKRLTLTVEEAAEVLGISRAFAYEAARRGDIPSIRIGRRILVPRAALGRMLEMPERQEPK